MLCVSAAVLAVCIFYTAVLARIPDYNLVLDSRSWTVLRSAPCEPEELHCLRVGDRVLSMGDLRLEEFLADWNLHLLRDMGPEGALEATAQRQGRTFEVELRPRARPLRSLAGYFAVPLVFWLVGTGVILLVRPRNASFFTLVVLCFSTALWIISGMAAYYHAAGSVYLYHALIWFFLPLLLHTHLLVPYPILARLRRLLVPALYAASAVMMVLDLQGILSRRHAQFWVGGAILFTIALVVYRSVHRTDTARSIADRILLFGVASGLLPIAVLVVLPQLAIGTAAQRLLHMIVSAVVVFIVPIWPLSYLYALSKQSKGSVELRANRLLGTYGFLCFFVTLFLICFSIGYRLTPDTVESRTALALTLALIFVVTAPPLWSRFQRFVDRTIYGIEYLPEEIIGVFAARIPTAFDRPKLREILLNEVLPTLMIRQSALYVWDEEGEVEEVYRSAESNDDAEELRTGEVYVGDLDYWMDLDQPTETGPGVDKPDWVRLAVPLHGRDRTIGVWLLGRRDPDDLYPRADRELLHSIANQIAPVLENMRLVERARQEVAENRRLHEQLVQSQKMEAIGRLSAGVAHDFNNLLSVILGYSSLLAAKYRGDETLTGYLADIRDAGDRAAGLTRQLLAFSRQQVLEAKVVDLDAVLEDVEKMLSRLTGEDVELVTDLAGDLPRVRIDAVQMGQVVMNLAVNARDAMPRGGRLELRTDHLVLAEPLEDRVQGQIPAGAYVLLTVADEGEGIPEHQLARIFEPYFTTKEMGKGTGLGLSMVYGIVSQFKGHIRVDSREGEGTIFSIYLPALTVEESKTDIQAPFESTDRSVGSETILVVEDEDSVRHVACEILESHGYRVHSASDGMEALAVYERFPGRFDALLTDVVMPQMKGTELAERLRRRQDDLVVIFMSGYNEESVFSGWRGNERPVLINKPFSPASLVDQMRTLLDRVKEGISVRPGPSPAP